MCIVLLKGKRDASFPAGKAGMQAEYELSPEHYR